MRRQSRNNTLIKTIGEKLQGLREKKGVSQIDVYIETNINVKRIEAGTQNITVSTLSDLCDYYEITLKDFFKEINH